MAHFALNKTLQDKEDEMYQAHWQTQQLQLMNARAQLAQNINRTMYNAIYNVSLDLRTPKFKSFLALCKL